MQPTCEIVRVRASEDERSTSLTQYADPARRDVPDSWDQPEIEAMTSLDGRRIELAGVLNLRDAGNYPVAGGGSVRWRALLRSDALHQLDSGGLAVLAGLDLRSVVDLRTQPETQAAPSRLDGLGARVTHVSILRGDLQGLPLELEAIYRYMVVDCADAIAEAIRALCAADAFPALVHCSAGKDRTGIVIALVLAVLGVPDQVIAADYALSSRYLDPDSTAAIGQLQASTGLGDSLTRPLLISPPALILDVLTWVRAAGGSVEGYLLDHGLSRAELQQLRAGLIG
jgi:protein-tyrosine phosphatase